jgi:hypothetical protein
MEGIVTLTAAVRLYDARAHTAVSIFSARAKAPVLPSSASCGSDWKVPAQVAGVTRFPRSKPLQCKHMRGVDASAFGQTRRSYAAAQALTPHACKLATCPPPRAVPPDDDSSVSPCTARRTSADVVLSSQQRFLTAWFRGSAFLAPKYAAASAKQRRVFARLSLRALVHHAALWRRRPS